MSTLKQLTLSVRRPPEIRVFSPKIFASSYEKRPTDDIAVGIKLLSDFDISCAKGNASKTAWAMVPNHNSIDERVDAYNDALMRRIVCACTTDPNDLSKPWFKQGILEVEIALTSDGVKAIFDAYEAACMAMSPVYRELSEEELPDFVELLTTIYRLGSMKRAKILRMLAYCFDEIVDG